jgi:transcriptional regulator with PAS, ATPase and Fis domain
MTRTGLFEQADGGTLFLDELGELPLDLQPKLLRALEQREVRRVGSTKAQKVDVRIIAATNRELRRDVEEGRFREDLFYRLRVVEIALPPLRQRREDIPMLAHHFLDFANREMSRKLQGFTNEAMDRLVAHAWGGNVRELENEIQRTVALAGAAETVSIEMLSEELRGAVAPALLPSREALDGPLGSAVDLLKRRMILEAIEATGSKTRAAEKLGIPRQSLQKMMRRLGIGS